MFRLRRRLSFERLENRHLLHGDVPSDLLGDTPSALTAQEVELREDFEGISTVYALERFGDGAPASIVAESGNRLLRLASDPAPSINTATFPAPNAGAYKEIRLSARIRISP